MASTHRDEISRLELLNAAHPDGLVFPHLADAYRRAGRYAQAESLLKAGLRRHADYSSAHVVLGRLRLDQGQHEAAERSFRRVLELDPQNQVALECLGRLSMDQGRLEDALHRFRQLVRLKPTEELDAQVRKLEQRLAKLRSASPSPPSTGDHGWRAAGPGPSENPPAARHPAGPPEKDPPFPEMPEPGEVVTETMAELYSRQGLHARAAAVYRQLLQRRPGDERLYARLNAAEEAAAGEGRESAPESPATASAASRSGSSLRAERLGAPPRGPDRVAPTRRTWSGRAEGPGGNDYSEGTPSSRRAAAPPAPISIRDHLGTVLSWTPRSGKPDGGERESIRPAPAEEAQQDASARRPDLRASPSQGLTPDGVGAHVLEELEPRSRTLIALADMLVGLLEYRDPFFRGGSSLTRLVAVNVGQEMRLSAEEQVDLSLAAVLRDLGRLAMGGRLVTPASPNPPREARRKIERHVDLALHLMEGIEIPESVRLAVRHHHERWDGQGYPDRLAGAQIPRLARILAVVDSFAAMLSPRPYRLPRKVPDAVRELKKAAGTQYDPSVVDSLVRVLAKREQPGLGFTQRHHILLVNPDQPGAVVTAAKLCSAGYLAEVAVDADAARERLRRVPVAAVVISAESGETEAALLVRELRVDPMFSSLPIVVVDADTVSLRVRLLESGADVCFPPGIAYAELQGTVGALVRRSFRGHRNESESGEAPWLALQGDVKDFPLTWLLQVMKYDSRTAGIGLRTATAEGAIYLQKGDAVHARIRGGESGEAALRRMLGWKQGRFTVQPDARAREQTIGTSIMHLLLTQAVDEDHAAAGIFGAVSAGG